MQEITRTRSPYRWLLTAAILLVLSLGMASQYTHASESLQTSQTLLTAATTGAAVAPALAPRQCREAAVYIEWSAGTNAGGVTVESAYAPTYAGTWAPLAVVAWTVANKADIVQITGVQGALRTRVSTTVTGGTVTTRFLCN